MAALPILILMLAFAAPAMAEPLRVGGCPELKPYVPPADIDASSGVDAKGWAIAPADMNPPMMDIESLKRPQVSVFLPLERYAPSQKQLQDAPLLGLYIGELQADNDGQMMLDGIPLAPDSLSIHPDCLR